MGRISLPLALLGMQAMLGAVVDARSNIHFTLLGVQAMLGMVAEAQYNVYYGYTAQELQEFIADTVIDCFFSFLNFLVLHFSIFFAPQETGMVVEELVYDGADCHCR